MKCPVDNEVLVISDRGGVEIDYCPKCRGVWLDRGELDKIIERSAPPPAPREERRDAPRGDREDDRYRARDEDRYRRDDGDRSYKPKRRESFLSDLFDF